MALKPFIFWAQTATEISLRIELRGITQHDINMEEEEMELSAFGIGAQGGDVVRKYHVVLEFYLPIDSSRSSYNVQESGIQVVLRKKDETWWPRLLHQQQKQPWLKIDFDRWKGDANDSDEGDGQEKDGAAAAAAAADTEEMLRAKYPDVFRDLEKSEFGHVVEKFRKTYLFCYNLFMLVGFLYVAAVMQLRFARLGEVFMIQTWEALGTIFRMIHLFMLLDVLHPLFGYTKSSLLEAVLQVGGRNILLFVIIGSEPRMQDKPFVFYIFAIYTVSELIRYLYDMLGVYDISLGLLTWLRFTCWIPLYPAGFLCQGVILLRSIPFFEETGKFSMSLPNAANVAFYFPHLLRFYLLFLSFPLLYMQMNRMYHFRCKKLKIRQHSLNRRKRDD